MFERADAAFLAVGVERVVAAALRPHLSGEFACRCAVVDAVGFGAYGCSGDVVLVDGFAERQSVGAFYVEVQQTVAFGQFAQYAEYAAGAVAVLHGIFWRVGRQFAQAGYAAAQRVDVLHREVHAALLCHGQQVQYGVGAAAHGDVETHGVEESRPRGYAAWQHALVAVFIVGEGVLDDLPCRPAEQFHALGVAGQDGAVAGQ